MIEGDDGIAEPRRVVAQRVVVAPIPSLQIDRAHPAAAALEDDVAPGVVAEAAADADRRACRHDDDDRIIGAGPGSQIDVGDGITIGTTRRRFGLRRREYRERRQQQR